MSAGEDIKALSFEAALQRLEAIVRQLESGDAPLEAAIGLYEEAQALKAHCEAKLKAAQERIEKIVVSEAGVPGAEPAASRRANSATHFSPQRRKLRPS